MKINKGDIFEVRISDGHVVYAQALNDPEFAFFTSNPSSNHDGSCLFRIWVHKSAKKHWKKIDTGEIPIELSVEAPRFKKDPITGEFSIYQDGTDREASYDQVKDLECAAVWEWPHIDERLVALFSGSESKWLNSLKATKNG